MSCLAKASYPLVNRITWYENGVSIYDLLKRPSAYLVIKTGYLKNTTLKHFTCKANNNMGYVSASISVLLRSRKYTVSIQLLTLPCILRFFVLAEGSWSWWTESSHCSVTCGFTPGFRIVERKCIETSRCRGLNYRMDTCFPQRRYCPESKTCKSSSNEKKYLKH